MKKIALILVAVVSLSACSKSPKGSSIQHTNCTCVYLKAPGRDTTVNYPMDANSSISVDSQCNYKEKVLLSFTGKNGAACELN